MTISLEPGYGTAGSASALALLRRSIIERLVRPIRRQARAVDVPTPSEVSFEIHVEQALSIARAVPTLHAVPTGQLRRTARS